MAGWTDRIKAFFAGGAGELTGGFFDDLCDLLIEGDFGAALAVKTVDALKLRCKKAKISGAGAAKAELSAMLAEYALSCAPEKPAAVLEEDALNAVLLLGVNGVGKTTSAAKLASLYSREGKTILAAADTFRAAAIEQLKIHGERLGIRVIAQKHNSDPAAVLHDAMEAAIHGKYLALVADTAGRMHTRAALIGELTKISRVIEGGAGEGRLVYRKFLVLDATTGGNALAQAETFNEAVKLDGVILTKFDSTARGGVVFPLAVNLKLPVVYVCDGERYEDIHEFNAESFVKEFLG